VLFAKNNFILLNRSNGGRKKKSEKQELVQINAHALFFGGEKTKPLF